MYPSLFVGLLVLGREPRTHLLDGDGPRRIGFQRIVGRHDLFSKPMLNAAIAGDRRHGAAGF